LMGRERSLWTECATSKWAPVSVACYSAADDIVVLWAVAPSAVVGGC
jgi:hypothetical protein